jgi:hypothetical protein
VLVGGQMLFVSSPMLAQGYGPRNLISFMHGGQLANLTEQNNADSHGAWECAAPRVRTERVGAGLGLLGLG